MNLAIMQPYFLPYIGYWQLLYAADVFLIYDDVNYIKSGWINRNRLLENGKSAYFNVLVSAASPNKLINEIERIHDYRVEEKLLRRIMACYKKASHFQETYPLINSIITDSEKNLAKYLENSIRCIADYLDIETPIKVSSTIAKDRSLKGQEKIIDICNNLGADVYYNAIGGQTLYDKERFKREGIELSFIETEKIEYAQYGNEFVPSLSILDVLMFNGKEKTKQYLDMYRLI